MIFDSIKVGETYFTVTRGKMGNTNISTVYIHPVKVININVEKKTVEASWNGNAPKTFHSNHYGKWHKHKPMTIRTVVGSVRLATKAELEAVKAGW